MVDWLSPEEIARNGQSFDRLIHCLLGLYIWEFVTSLDFDLDYLRGRKKFRWPLIFYFANRYFLLFALIGIAIALNVTKPVNCQALYTYNQVFGNAAVGLASINLSLRTIAVWSQSKILILLLVIVIMGHWSMLLHGILLKAAWVDGVGCVITQTSNKLLAATFVYSMCFDFTVLCLTAVKLALPGARAPRSKLSTMIFSDGLIFFIIAFLANLVATIFMLLNLNPVMSIIANVPAAIASTIVACRAVRRLTNYTSQGAEVFNSSQATTTLAFSPSGRGRLGTTLSVVSEGKVDGVHVQMDTFNINDDTPSDKGYVQYDAAGKVIGPNSEIDPESQAISADFKKPVDGYYNVGV